eukprot:ANDGO_01927.mRNA.1 Putative serine/threonine-protein kinase A
MSKYYSAVPEKSHSKLSEFKILQFLGKGSYGSVHRVLRHSDGQEYAMKEVKIKSMSQREREEAVNEIRLLASVNHPAVVRYHEAFVEDDKLFIVTEFAREGDLATRISKQKSKNKYFEEDQIWSLLIQMLLGLQAVHNMNILHRDLKSPNIFLDSDDIIKIGDLGVAKLVKSTGITRTQVGTPYYVAPEIWRNMPYDTKCDIWSLGVLLYELMTLRRPFEGNSIKDLAANVLRNQYKPVPTFYSKELSELVKKMLVLDPAARPTVNSILAIPVVAKRMSAMCEKFGWSKKESASVAVSKPGAAGNPKPRSTIKVPRNLTQLHLPTPNYPSAQACLDSGASADEIPVAGVLFPRIAQSSSSAANGSNNGQGGLPAGCAAGIPPLPPTSNGNYGRALPSVVQSQHQAYQVRRLGAGAGVSVVVASNRPPAPIPQPPMAPRPPVYMRRADPLRY